MVFKAEFKYVRLKYGKIVRVPIIVSFSVVPLFINFFLYEHRLKFLSLKISNNQNKINPHRVLFHNLPIQCFSITSQLEFETVPYLFREVEVNIVNFHRFLRDKGIELDDTTELRVVETKMLAAIRDLYAAAIAKEDAERRVS